MNNWTRTLLMLGSDVVQCDGSVDWDDSETAGARIKFKDCRIAIADLKNQRYHSIELDRKVLRDLFDSTGLHDDHSRKMNIVSMIELMAIQFAFTKYPGFMIESDSQTAVISSKVLCPSINIVWRCKEDLPLPHLIATKTPQGLGTFSFSDKIPKRGWLTFNPEASNV